METEVIELKYATDERIDRRKGNTGTNEFFTPSALVQRMCDMYHSEIWSDFSKTILEPSAGNYNFVVEVIKRRLQNCKTQKECEAAMSTLYSIELMPDNVKEGKERVRKLIKALILKFQRKQKNTLKIIMFALISLNGIVRIGDI